jgi:hypothetical protein
MNTTQLIEHWTMQGAEQDIDRRFRATDDILEVMAAQHDAPQASRLAPVQVRGADDEGWTALQIGG